MSLSEFLKNYRLDHNMSMDDFAQRSGLSKPYISMLEKNRNSKNGKAITPSIRTYKKIATAVGLSVDNLMRMLNGDEMVSLADPATTTTPASTTTPKAQNITATEKRMVPVLGSIAAGQPIYADEHIETYVPCDARCHVDFGVMVRGDSMIDVGIEEGDIVFIQRTPDVDDGQIAAVRIDDTATLKRVYHIPGGVRLVSENPNYSPMIFTAENCDAIQILGLAVAKFSWIER